MPMQYNSEDASKCLPEGEYDAVLSKVIDRTFNSGNAGQEWHITVYDANGKDWLIKEYVTASAPFKVRDLARALNKAEDFKTNKFQADDYEGTNVRVSLTIEKSDKYDDKNRIGKFLPPLRQNLPQSNGRRQPLSAASPVKDKPTEPAQPPYDSKAKDFNDDDIPF